MLDVIFQMLFKLFTYKYSRHLFFYILHLHLTVIILFLQLLYFEHEENGGYGLALQVTLILETVWFHVPLFIFQVSIIINYVQL